MMKVRSLNRSKCLGLTIGLMLCVILLLLQYYHKHHPYYILGMDANIEVVCLPGHPDMCSIRCSDEYIHKHPDDDMGC